MAYEPTHTAPEGGLPAWPTPDGTGAPAATLGAGLDVQVLERTGDWAHIECSNGWKAWVDGRRLVALAAPVAEPPTPAPTAPPVESAATPTPQPTPAAPHEPGPVTLSPVGTAPERAAPTPMPRSEATMPAASGSGSYASATRPAAGAAATPTAAAAPAAAAPEKARGSLGLGGILALLGAGIVFLSTLPAWLDLGVGENAFDTPVEYLRDNVVGVEDTLSGEVGLSIGVVLLVVGALIALGGVFRRMRLLAIVGGVLALVIAVDHLYQSKMVADESNGVFGFGDVTGPAPFLLIVGAVLAIVGGIVGLRQRK